MFRYFVKLPVVITNGCKSSSLSSHCYLKRLLVQCDSRCIQINTVSTGASKWKKKKEEDNTKSKSPKNRIKTFGVIDVWRNMTVKDLAVAVGKDIEHIQEVMLYVKEADDLRPSAMLTSIKTIQEIVKKCGLKSKIISAPTEGEEQVETKDKDVVPQEPAPLDRCKPRAPVVTVMGHVDHGKTTLLDTLRGASVAAGEAGGITQHIGAFTVTLSNDEQVTFLDTPGHAAFSAMRARGAQLTDIVVLVVAADDGVMEQTKEVIHLAKDCKVPVIVAINKIDKPEADIARTKKSLMQMGVALEEFGGEIQSVNISALAGTNLAELVDAISTQAVLMGLKSDFGGLVEGVVVECKTDSRRGKLATAIVKRGTLRKGSILVSGVAWAKVRGLFDHNGQVVESACPGMPVEILGWRELPSAGDIILEVESEKKAQSVLRYRNSQKLMEKAIQDLEVIKKKEEEHLEKYRAERTARRQLGRYKTRTTFRPKESLPDDPTPRINLILKGDVHGSVEAILDVLDTYNDDSKCRLDIVHYGVGDIIESDLELASTFNAMIYAFDVKLPKKVPGGVKIKEFNIIYRLIDDLKEEINRKLPTIDVEEVIGEANVLQLFDITEGRKEVTVLGCRCVKGTLKKAMHYKIKRNDEIIYDGKLESMRHLKNEVDSIKNGVECGLRFQDFEAEVRPGDTIICYTIKQEPQKTDWDPGF